ncbi:MAG TPA: tyrosine/phenylalanine carboxypeptidase domain-containing protein [Acidimicrobiia bacterium]|nr:tyrosine/phenylalanine carboxypeptidase domain-containing protein [Acidimicrobiia bacterium]
MTGTSLTPADSRIDEELTDISGSFQFLLDVTPTNTPDARASFLADPATRPSFEYRPLGDTADRIRARLADVDVNAASDAALAHLFTRKRAELELQAEMLDARGTDDFLPLSIELFGAVAPRLVAVAERILGLVEPDPTPRSHCLDAVGVAAELRTAMDDYAPLVAELGLSVHIRDDVAGVMVSNGQVLVADTVSVSPTRLAGLIAHEVHTHVLTYINGSMQPLTLMAAGFAGYEESQEGLALTAEVMVGGLTIGRLRQLAARVVAVDALIQGAAFAEVHRGLVETHGYSASGAFGITMRVFRSGGLTKDAGYLRGLRRMVEHSASGAPLEDLWMGKLDLADLPLVEQLKDQGVLSPPAVLPGFLADRDARDRMADFAETVGAHELIGAEK